MKRLGRIGAWRRFGLQAGVRAGIGLAFAGGRPPVGAAPPPGCLDEGSCAIKKPMLLFVLDYSTSMNKDFGGQGTRWEVAVGAVQSTLVANNGFLISNYVVGLMRFGHDPLPLAAGTKIANDAWGLVDGVKLDVPFYDPGDPDKEKFGFVAGPKHFIEELGNPSAEFRRRLSDSVNALPVDCVVLDLRAGLDANVLDFLPYTNSGMLVVTPNLPQATLAASDIVKAILFRTLRLIFAPDSEVFKQPGLADGRELIHDLLDQAEDVYDDRVENLDGVLRELKKLFGDQPLLRVLEWVIQDFRIHYVLNMFNGIEESGRAAIDPAHYMENKKTQLMGN